MKTVYRFIQFVETSNLAQKTRRFQVRNTKSGDLLGIVRWFGPWRSYAIEYCDGTIFDESCTADLMDFFKQLKEERKAAASA